MVHIDISTETKITLNKVRGMLQTSKENTSQLITYDKAVKYLCLLYLKSKEE